MAFHRDQALITSGTPSVFDYPIALRRLSQCSLLLGGWVGARARFKNYGRSLPFSLPSCSAHPIPLASEPARATPEPGPALTGKRSRVSGKRGTGARRPCGARGSRLDLVSREQ